MAQVAVELLGAGVGPGLLGLVAGVEQRGLAAGDGLVQQAALRARRVLVRRVYGISLADDPPVE